MVYRTRLENESLARDREFESHLLRTLKIEERNNRLMPTPAKNLIISIVMLISIGGIYYFVSDKLSDKQSFERQSLCAKDGDKYDEKFRRESTSTWTKYGLPYPIQPTFYNSEYVYSKKINSCVFYGGFTTADNITRHTLLDIYSNQILYQTTRNSQQKSKMMGGIITKSDTLEVLKSDLDFLKEQAQESIDFWENKKELFNGSASESDDYNLNAAKSDLDWVNKH